jgi:hypothetical protein
MLLDPKADSLLAFLGNYLDDAERPLHECLIPTSRRAAGASIFTAYLFEQQP